MTHCRSRRPHSNLLVNLNRKPEHRVKCQSDSAENPSPYLDIPSRPSRLNSSGLNDDSEPGAPQPELRWHDASNLNFRPRRAGARCRDAKLCISAAESAGPSSEGTGPESPDRPGVTGPDLRAARRSARPSSEGTGPARPTGPSARVAWALKAGAQVLSSAVH